MAFSECLKLAKIGKKWLRPWRLPAKEYVFIPKSKAPSRFSEEDLQFNDPLAIDPFGKALPVPDKRR